MDTSFQMTQSGLYLEARMVVLWLLGCVLNILTWYMVQYQLVDHCWHRLISKVDKSASFSKCMLLHKQFCVTEYYIVVEDALKQHSQQCVDTVADANLQFHAMLRHRNGQKQITEKFRWVSLPEHKTLILM